MTVLPVNLDDDLIELLDAQAAASGTSRSEVLAAAIRRGLGGGRLAQTLAAYRIESEIGEDDALALAKAEIAAARAESNTA
ncbi:ribbon-helix-helix protein, CopG family [Nocardioides sp. GXZ039]|uniref:ribbon-helix-helix protein, CopG family n=1 Tax=Nocardioides sp. GXZ039 TaxID=3136018 RepID=UPI0030F4A816